MKREQLLNSPPVALRFVMSILLVFAFSILTLGLNAQSATQIASTDPSMVFMEKNPENSVVKFYQNNPNDPQAAKALRFAMILDNPAAFPEITSEHLGKLQSEQKEMLLRINFIEEQLKNGNTYERAAEMYQKNADMEMNQRKNNDSNTQNSEPAMMVPTQK